MAEEGHKLRDAPGRFISNNPTLLAFLVLAVGIAAVIVLRVSESNSFERRVCHSAMEDRLFILDLVNGPTGGSSDDQPIDPTLPANVQALIRQSRDQGRQFRKFVSDQVHVPPIVCEHTGVDVNKLIRNHKPFTPVTVPASSGALSPTTTSTEPTARASPSTARDRSTTSSRPNFRSTTTTTQRSSPATTSAPPTTAAPTTTTTAPCNVSVSGLGICVRGASSTSSGMGWAKLFRWLQVAFL